MHFFALPGKPQAVGTISRGGGQSIIPRNPSWSRGRVLLRAELVHMRSYHRTVYVVLGTLFVLHTRKPHCVLNTFLACLIPAAQQAHPLTVPDTGPAVPGITLKSGEPRIRAEDYLPGRAVNLN